MQTEDISTLMRFAIWEELLSKLFQSPITTIFGFGQLGPSYVGGAIALGPIYYVAENYSAHSEYVDQLVRGGTVALVIITALYASVVISSFRVFRKSALLGPAFRGIAIGLIGAAVYATNHESLRYSWFGIMFWILVGALSNFNGRFQRRTRQRGVPRVDAAQRLTA